MAMTDVKYDTEQQMKIKQLYKVGSECELKLLLRLILWCEYYMYQFNPLQSFDYLYKTLIELNVAADKNNSAMKSKTELKMKLE